MMGRLYGNRWGRFKISGHFMEEVAAQTSAGNWDRVGALLGFMAQCFIVRAGGAVTGDCIEYWAVSPHFDELEEGEAIPEYSIEFQRVEEDCPFCQGTGCCDHCEQGKVLKDYFHATKRFPETPPGSTLQAILRNDLEEILAEQFKGAQSAIVGLTSVEAAKKFAPGLRQAILNKWVNL